MATRTTASKPARQLGELLQEQQEPFILEVCLSERGCVRKNLTSGANFIRYHGSSGKFLTKSGNKNKSKKGTPHFLKVLKVVLCNKFFTIKGLRTKNSDDDGEPSVTEMDMDRNNQETAEPDRFSSSSCSTVYNSCSDSDNIDEPSMFPDNSKSSKLYAEREKKIQSLNGVLAWKTVNNTALSQCQKKYVLQQAPHLIPQDEFPAQGRKASFCQS